MGNGQPCLLTSTCYIWWLNILIFLVRRKTSTTEHVQEVLVGTRAVNRPSRRVSWRWSVICCLVFGFNFPLCPLARSSPLVSFSLLFLLFFQPLCLVFRVFLTSAFLLSRPLLQLSRLEAWNRFHSFLLLTKVSRQQNFYATYIFTLNCSWTIICVSKTMYTAAQLSTQLWRR